MCAPSMNCGGAERVIITLLTHLNTEIYEPVLALVKREGSLLPEVPEHVEVVDFNERRSRYVILKLLRLIWKKRPDVVFSSLSHLNMLAIVLRLLSPAKTRFVCRETNMPGMALNRSAKGLFSLLYIVFYRRYHAIICPSTDIREKLIAQYRVPSNAIITINNPCDIDRIEKEIGNSIESNIYLDDKYNILSVASLTYQKGHDLLFKAIKRLNSGKYHLTIIGEGENEYTLTELAKTLNISDQIDFRGFKSNPYTYMKQADLFVLSSRYEGFPNVVLEAMACGTPVVAFDSPGDLKKIIISGENGFLAVPLDINDLAAKIKLAEKTIFNTERIRNSINERFAICKIMPKYESVFGERRNTL